MKRRGFVGGAAAVSLARPAIVRAAPDEVVFGAIWPLTGAMAPSGIDAIAAVETAVQIINDGLDVGLNLGKTKGLPGLGGAKLRMISADHQGDPLKGRSEAERLITQEHVCAILGASYSSVAATINQVTERYNVPFVVADSSSPSLSRRGMKTFFRPSAHDEMFTIGMFDFYSTMKGKGVDVKTVALIYEDTLFGTDSSRVQRDLAAKHGIKVVTDIKYRANSPTLSTEIQQIIAARPDALMPSSYINDAILIMKTMAEFNYRPPGLVAQDAGFNDPTFIKTIDRLAEGIISRSSFSLDLAQKRPFVKTVNDIFRKRAGKDLADSSSRAFSSVFVLGDAVSRAGSTQPEAIIAALRTTDIPGIETIMPWKQVHFDETGQNPDATPIMVQFQHGDFKTVWPQEAASVATIWPMPA
jgi:branched-chain amino acid transport system substrate-binding protein